MKYLLICLALLLPSMAAAQEILYSNDATKSCEARAYGEAGARPCIGASANACMEATEGGSTTVGMGACLERELEYWDLRLNDAYRRLRARDKRGDAELAELGSNAPKAVTALRDMQRAWITYRTLTCDYEYTKWQGGTGGGPASMACVLRMTGEQSLYLEGMRENF